MKAELTILYEKGKDGWWLASIPEVPGAFSQGRTRAQARANVIDVLDQLMAARRDLALAGAGPDSSIEPLPLAG